MACDEKEKVFNIFKTKNTYSPKLIESSCKPEKVLNNKKKLYDKIEAKEVTKSKSSNAAKNTQQSTKEKQLPKKDTKQTKISNFLGSDLESLSNGEDDKDEPKIEECKFNEKTSTNLKKQPFKMSNKPKEEELFKLGKPREDQQKLMKPKISTFEDLKRKQIDNSKMHVSKALDYLKQLKTDKKSDITPLGEKQLIHEENKENSTRLEKKEVNKALEYVAKLKAEQKLIELEEEKEKQKMLESNKENVNKLMAYITKVNSEKLKRVESEQNVCSQKTIVLDSDFDMSQQEEEQQQKKLIRISPKRKESEPEFEEISENDTDLSSSKKKSNNLKPKREYDYELIDENFEIESQIENVKTINFLTEVQIEYMVLRDINYYIDIFSGNCDHSWRHLEFKKYSKKSGNLLYSNSALSSFRSEQYTAAVKALQSIFCRKNNKFDEYIVKVLLPEALIKICMRVYQCSKDSAEEFLQHNNFKNDFKEIPKGSVKSSVK